jgi:hypothetical protein
MNIDDMKLGELKAIAAMFNSGGVEKKQHPYIGKYVIARCYAAGVHAGDVESVDGENVVLSNSRRLWSWKAKDGIALSGVAQKGLQSGCKVDVLNPSIYLTGVCELIPCSESVKAGINGY